MPTSERNLPKHTLLGFSMILHLVVAIFSISAVLGEEPIAILRERILKDLIPSYETPNWDKEADWLLQTQLPNGQWPDVNYNDTNGRSWWETGVHLFRAKGLAALYNSQHSSHSNSPAVYNASLHALEWWLNENVLNTNWWWNQIGTPSAVGDTIILLGSNSSLISRAAPIFARSPLSFARGETGANRVWVSTVSILLGAATQNATLVAEAYDVAYSAVVPGSEMGEDGIMGDGSFHQHSDKGRGQLYSGWGYGAIYTTTVLTIARWSAQLPWAIDSSKWDTLMHLALVGQQLITRGTNFDWTASGRLSSYFAAFDSYGVDAGHYHYPAAFRPFELSFPRFEAPMTTPLAVVYAPLLADAATWVPANATELEHFYSRIMTGSPAIPNSNTHFFDSDYIVHHRDAFFASTRAFSNRSLACECVNDEGKQLRDQSDFVFGLYLTGTEMENVYPVLNYSRLAGTTEHQTGRPYTCGDRSFNTHNSFVGGISDGMYGGMVMDFMSGHVTTLWVGKAAFFFDDVVVGLGAGLGSIGSPPYPILTSLDQRNLRSTVTYQQTASSSPSKLPPNSTIQDMPLQWLHHDQIGYVLPNSPPVFLSNMYQNGSWYNITQGPPDPISKPVFSAAIQHGELGVGKNSSYVFFAFPNATVDQMPQLASAPPIVVLENTRNGKSSSEPGIQAVCHSKDGILIAAIYPPLADPFGPPGYISASISSASDHGCLNIQSIDLEGLVLVRTTNNMLTASFSNPMVERHPIDASIVLPDVKATGDGCEPDTSSSGTKVSFSLTGGPMMGGETITRSCMISS